jgi:hypothetical protein
MCIFLTAGRIRQLSEITHAPSAQWRNGAMMRTRNLRKVRSLHQERHGCLHVMTLRRRRPIFCAFPTGLFKYQRLSRQRNGNLIVNKPYFLLSLQQLSFGLGQPL